MFILDFILFDADSDDRDDFNGDLLFKIKYPRILMMVMNSYFELTEMKKKNEELRIILNCSQVLLLCSTEASKQN